MMINQNNQPQDAVYNNDCLECNKPWLKNYPDGVPENAVIPNITLNDLFVNTCASHANNCGFTCHNVTLNFAQVQELVNNLAQSLLAIGCKKGDKIAIILPNLLQYPIALFAILKIGAIVVNINPLYTASEIEYIMRDANVSSAIVLDMMAKKLNDIVLSADTPLKRVVVTKIADLYPWFKRTLFTLAIKYLQRVDVSYQYQAYKFVDLLSSANKCDATCEAALINKASSHNEIAFIQYTGATTGKPKGAILTHANIVANLAQIRAWLIGQHVELDKQIAINALPLYHIFSLTANMFTFFFEGSQNIMIPNPRDVKDLLKTLNKYCFTTFNSLDTLYNHLLQSAQFRKSHYPCFKYSVAGGMPAMRAVANNWLASTGVTPSNCYGLTESSPAVTMSLFNDEFDGSVGYPLPNTLVEIRAATGNTNEVLAIGQTGVIWIKGPQVTSGYYCNQAQTKQAFDQNGWFNTHDLGYFNEAGKLFISGRLNDMIIVSGFNVYPVEVELVLTDMPEIKEAAVLGTTDSATGERVVAFIVFNDGAHLSDSELRARCHQHLASYKIPHQYIHLTNNLPKTLVGKVNKVALAKQYL